MLTRKLSAGLTLVLVAAMIWLDLIASQPLDPFRTPAVFALGSGQAGAGAHCAALPTAN
jgi:hypothetical protein